MQAQIWRRPDDISAEAQRLDVGSEHRLEIIADGGGAPRLYIFWNETEA